ncbi:hypothetical protein [uncultured Variovorax sp.]|mgnify:CR=1 FL=1|jgi:hypothetical protein|uniref:hypothetical protein n=1 Tax=uncultured Variovorax sp. TaxID=114708 RepID=UPI0026289D95|nr:hypothetical protein [uncultured Variovorax sp.]
MPYTDELRRLRILCGNGFDCSSAASWFPTSFLHAFALADVDQAFAIFHGMRDNATKMLIWP